MQDWPAINARRFELYVRWSLYLLMTLLPFMIASIAVGAARNLGVALAALGVLGLSLVTTAFNVIAIRWGLDQLLARERPWPRWFALAWAASVLATTVAVVALLAMIPGTILTASLPLGLAVAALTPTFTARRTVIVSIIATVLFGVLALFGHPEGLLALALFLLAIWAAWPSGWMLRVLRQLQEARDMAAQLSVAEERLRISRDLHDVFGRTLATISVKSELAAELSRRGHHDRAADEMAQVRRIANTAGVEVRRVVRGERRTSWTEEIEGARALLASAGIHCRITGDEVPEEQAATLAWVIREGVTNVLRHSRATQVNISAAVEDDEVTLTVSNDGSDTPRSGGGTGLASMAARLATVGGTLDHVHDGEWFLLTASIPVSQESPT